MQKINAAEFKAKCLAILDEAYRTGQPVTILKRGKPVAQVVPPVPALPDSFHRDPGDRIIVASAQILGATLLSHDQRIIDAALVPTL